MSISSMVFHTVQWATIAAITGRWEPSHYRQLSELGLERLSARRTRLCKTFAQRTATNSRHMDMFTPVNSTRRLGTYRDIFARTATYYKSALPYLTRLLNQWKPMYSWTMAWRCSFCFAFCTNILHRFELWIAYHVDNKTDYIYVTFICLLCKLM